MTFNARTRTACAAERPAPTCLRCDPTAHCSTACRCRPGSRPTPRSPTSRCTTSTADQRRAAPSCRRPSGERSPGSRAAAAPRARVRPGALRADWVRAISRSPSRGATGCTLRRHDRRRRWHLLPAPVYGRPEARSTATAGRATGVAGRGGHPAGADCRARGHHAVQNPPRVDACQRLARPGRATTSQAGSGCSTRRPIRACQAVRQQLAAHVDRQQRRCNLDAWSERSSTSRCSTARTLATRSRLPTEPCR